MSAINLIARTGLTDHCHVVQDTPNVIGRIAIRPLCGKPAYAKVVVGVEQFCLCQNHFGDAADMLQSCDVKIVKKPKLTRRHGGLT